MCSIGDLKSLLPKFQCGGHSMIVSLTTCDQTPDLVGQTLDHADTFPQPSDDFHRRGALHQPIVAVCYGQKVITGVKLLSVYIHIRCLMYT